ncbi:hypothetical protein HDU87_006152 [Geranomyces variabilis]|uniref:Uncharacterized protein n=1 Tax=Geranomyces variabilis TaxID=109894 RepID=A0AAD5TFU3_9FUNG|nr:hypothetical protein HDU87_006152 [Geranomyces variabilis]
MAEADDELTDTIREARRARKKSKKAKPEWYELLTSDLWGLLGTDPKADASGVLTEIAEVLGVTDAVNLYDLRTHAGTLGKLPYDVAAKYGDELDRRWKDLVPNEVHVFLDQFFGALKKKKADEWERALEDTRDQSSPMLTNVLGMVKQILPAFCRAFTREDNPLKNCQSLETDYLQTYIHPIFREACHRFGKTVWQSGEISTKYFVDRQKADGVAIVPSRDNFPVAYFEGAKPVSRHSKRTADMEKTMQNVVSIQYHTIKELLSSRRRVPAMLQTFGAQSINLEIVCCLLEYHEGNLFLHEVDRANVPAQAEDVELFPEFYTCIMGWTVSIRFYMRGVNNEKNQTVIDKPHGGPLGECKNNQAS